MFSVEITESLSGCSQSRLCGSCRNPPDTVYKREAEKRQAAVGVTDNRESDTGRWNRDAPKEKAGSPCQVGSDPFVPRDAMRPSAFPRE